MADYIYPGPGGANDVSLWVNVIGTSTGNVVVPALQDVTINASNDVFTWTQLDAAAKKQIATTATNSLDMNLVVDKDTFFGANATAAGTASATDQGMFGISRNKAKINFELFLGSESGNVSSNVTISGTGFVTGLAPTVSADAPVWVTPITITVDSDYVTQFDTAPKTT